MSVNLLLAVKNSTLSREFKSFAAVAGLATIGDVLEHPPVVLLKMPGFDNHLLIEWIGFLEQNRIAHLLRE